MMKPMFYVTIAMSLIAFTFLFVKYREDNPVYTDTYYQNFDEIKGKKKDVYKDEDYVFEVKDKKYTIMSGVVAQKLGLIEKSDSNLYQLLLFDEKQNLIFSKMTTKEYNIKTIRECSDTDGSTYIFYSKYDMSQKNPCIENLKNTYVMEIDIDNCEIRKEYEFGPFVMVLSIHDGYVYTLEDGRIFKKLLGDTQRGDCIKDLRFRGSPDIEEYSALTFLTESDGIKISADVLLPVTLYSFLSEELYEIKYTDTPIKIKRLYDNE